MWTCLSQHFTNVHQWSLFTHVHWTNVGKKGVHMHFATPTILNPKQSCDRYSQATVCLCICLGYQRSAIQPPRSGHHHTFPWLRVTWEKLELRMEKQETYSYSYSKLPMWTSLGKHPPSWWWSPEQPQQSMNVIHAAPPSKKRPENSVEPSCFGAVPLQKVRD